MNGSIDIVIPWVDGTDSAWISDKEKWFGMLHPEREWNNQNRYQDWDNLKYWFRAIEKNLPWVHKIFLVTCGHVPDFLVKDHPKLEIVRHRDFIPAEYLPTFQVNPIELNIHRIAGLSEQFVYFNDDLFPLRETEETYYFQDGKVCDEAIETPLIPVFFGDVSQFAWNMKALDTAIINRHFDKREVQKAAEEKWFFEGYGELLERNDCCRYWDHFTGFRDPHMPNAFRKESFAEVWEAEPEILDRTCRDKFRSLSDVNQWLVRYWQLCKGDFVPRRTEGKSYVVTVDNCEEIAEVIENRKQPMICLNEQCEPEEFERIRSVINAAFERIFPEKSSFER